jgi:hypothetical protein
MFVSMVLMQWPKQVQCMAGNSDREGTKGAASSDPLFTGTFVSIVIRMTCLSERAGLLIPAMHPADCWHLTLGQPVNAHSKFQTWNFATITEQRQIGNADFEVISPLTPRLLAVFYMLLQHKINISLRNIYMSTSIIYCEKQFSGSPSARQSQCAMTRP